MVSRPSSVEAVLMSVEQQKLVEKQRLIEQPINDNQRLESSLQVVTCI